MGVIEIVLDKPGLGCSGSSVVGNQVWVACYSKEDHNDGLT